MIADAGGIGAGSSKVRGIVRQLDALASDPNLDPEDLALFAQLRQYVSAAEGDALRELRHRRYSWATLAAQYGVTRQALRKRHPGL